MRLGLYGQRRVAVVVGAQQRDGEGPVDTVGEGADQVVGRLAAVRVQEDVAGHWADQAVLHLHLHRVGLGEGRTK